LEIVRLRIAAVSTTAGSWPVLRLEIWWGDWPASECVGREMVWTESGPGWQVQHVQRHGGNRLARRL